MSPSRSIVISIESGIRRGRSESEHHHYLVSPVAALPLGLALYLWRREQPVRAALFVGFALVALGGLHLAFTVAGIVVILE